jgi:serine/threonine-protein kinase
MDSRESRAPHSDPYRSKPAHGFREPSFNVTPAQQHQGRASSLSLLSDAPIELPFEPGEIIGGKYEVGELIGAGGMGYVVAAKHVDLGESVALKFLRREALAHDELVMRFATEARAAVRIKSEYVARVFDVGNLPDGVPYIVMEHLSGKDLCQLLHEQGQLPVRLVVEYVMQVCEALATAHSVGVVHRDIKPENLFLTDRAQGMSIVKVLDFGISKVALTGSAFDRKERFAKTMMPMGSPVYMSPEQIRADQDIDARTDIWSLGCVLYELLTGVPAFDAPSLTQLSATILEKDPVAMASLAPEVPPELEAIVLRCLEKNRKARFRNVAELAIALYPFGPRRARIFAERCASLLAESGEGHVELDLPSVAPPPMGRSTGPTGPIYGSAPTSTNSPTAVVVEDPEIENPPFVKKRRRTWVLASLTCAAIVGAYAGARQESSVGNAPPAPKPAAAAARAVAQANTQAAAPSPVVEPTPSHVAVKSATPAAPAAATPSAAPAPKAAATAAQRRAAAAAAAARSKHESPRPARGGDELDVGF